MLQQLQLFSLHVFGAAKSAFLRCNIYNSVVVHSKRLFLVLVLTTIYQNKLYIKTLHIFCDEEKMKRLVFGWAYHFDLGPI